MALRTPSRAQRPVPRAARGLQKNNKGSVSSNKQQQQRHNQGERATPQVIQYNPRTRLRERTTPPTAQDSAASRTTKGGSWASASTSFRSTHGKDFGAEKARTGTRSILHTRADTTARHQATCTLATDKGTTNGTGAQHMIDERSRNTRLLNTTLVRCFMIRNNKRHKGKSITSTKATNTTRDTGAQRDTPSLQELVSNTRTSERKTKHSPKATGQASNHAAQLWIHERL